MFGAGFELHPVKDVPIKAQEEAARISLELEQEELKKAESLKSTVASLSAEYQKELRSIIGEANLEGYYEFRAPLRERVRDVRVKAKSTVEGEAELKEAQHQAVKESHKFLEEIGFDMGRASKLREDYNTRINEAVSKFQAMPEKPNYLLLPEAVPLSDIMATPWVIYSPAYPGDAWAYWWHRSDEADNPSFVRYLNRASGELGSYTRTSVSGADDSDDSYVRYRTAMRFWYQIPATGLAEVYMLLQAINTSYSGSLSDEFGWSDARCEQVSSAYLQVISPGPGAIRYATILNYVRTGTTANWSGQVTAPGAQRWSQLFSNDSYTAGTWLLLEVGIEDWNYFRSNDVTVYSAMTMNWFLKNVYVRSTGG